MARKPSPPVRSTVGTDPQAILSAGLRGWLLTCLVISLVVHVYILVASGIDTLVGLDAPLHAGPLEGLPVAVDGDAERELSERERSQKVLDEKARARASGRQEDTSGYSEEEKLRLGITDDEVKASGAGSAQDMIQEAPKEGPNLKFDIKELDKLNVEL